MTNPLFTALEEFEMLQTHFCGLIEGYNKKMEWFVIEARLETVLASFKSLRKSILDIKPQWQNIDTAPKNGTIFISFDTSGEILFCHWCIGPASDHPELANWSIWRSENDYGENFIPTHWMPLPKPPEVKE